MSDRKVFVIDDDAVMRKALDDILSSSGYEICSLSHPKDFFRIPADQIAGCIVVDVRMPELDGLSFQRQLNERNIGLPVIFISGYADVPTSVRAMQQGAVTFLVKPFRESELLDAVGQALQLELSTRAERLERQRLRAVMAQLDERERTIMTEVADGKLNKTIASRLGLSEISVKVMRGRIMRKLGATSVAQLARMVERVWHGR